MTKHWTPRRKLEIIEQAKTMGDQIVVAENGLTFNEFDEWVYAYKKHGLRGLKTTLTKRLRHTTKP